MLAEGTYAEVQADPRVQEVYLGSAGATRGARRRTPGRDAGSEPAASGTQERATSPATTTNDDEEA